VTWVLDFDPEDLDQDGNSSDEEAGKASDMNAGREHYQSVG
jgi:protein AATF/BFR2